MIRGKVVNSYPKNGTMQFVFALTGSQEELSAYKEAKGEFYKEDEDGRPLYWTSRPSGAQITLKITTNGNVVEDTTQMDIDAAIAKRFGGNYGNVYAQVAIADRLANRVPVSTSVPQETPEKEEKL